VSRKCLLLLVSSSSSKPITYRSRYEIANDILRVINDNPIIKKRHKTGIGYAANLSYSQTVKLVRGLIDQGLLKRISDDIGLYRHYEITDKGIRYLQLFTEIEDDLQPQT
jgi:predicted transcriptional regulator